MHVQARFKRATHIGFADDLHERRAGAVDVDQAVSITMQEARGIFLEVDAGDANAPDLPVMLDGEIAVFTERDVVL